MALLGKITKKHVSLVSDEKRRLNFAAFKTKEHLNCPVSYPLSC
jgi:hypothetical protein